MLLEIKVPCYYEKYYQADQEIVQLCQKITENVKGVEYSKILK